MMPPMRGASPFLPLITPRELAITATCRPSIAPCPDVVAHAMIGRNHVVQLFGISLRRGVRPACRRRMRQPADVLADPDQTVLIVFGAVMRDGADGGVCRGAAQRFRVHHLPRGPFDEIWSAQAHE